jgi:hypothetical protein
MNAFRVCRARNMIQVFWTEVKRMLGDRQIRFHIQKEIPSRYQKQNLEKE